MTKKQCFKCNEEKELSEFYKHKQTSDGHLGKCKECAKKDVKNRYYDPEARKKIITYEKKRFKDQKRKKNIAIYQRRTRAKNPEKYKTRNATSNAIRDGRLIRKPCEVCGEEKTEAHHLDYADPLKVRWLCRKHHLIEEGKTPYSIK